MARATNDPKQLNNPSLSFLYNNVLGRVLLKILTRPFVSKICGWYLNSNFSLWYIDRFIKKRNIDMSLYKKQKYSSFNDFFIRQKKFKSDLESDHFISPCDAKLLVYQINDDSTFNIKGSFYNLSDLVDNQILPPLYKGGYALIFRLSDRDYHRYIYIDNGHKSRNFTIKGVLHTVQSIALKHYNIYHKNSREYTILHTERFDDVIQVEVGALMIGKITNYHQRHDFKKGEEKGRFEFGGSTIVLLVKKDIIKLDQEILENSQKNLETIVNVGECIAQKERM